jgi:hypothetical protein
MRRLIPVGMISRGDGKCCRTTANYREDSEAAGDREKLLR